jgi:uncharacterized protein (DUF934 family)
MPTLLKNNQLTTDTYQVISLSGEATPPLPDGDILVSLEDWLAHRDHLACHFGALGVQLESHTEPGQIREGLEHLDLIAVYFPVFSDGRGYSLARLLRERYHFEGELRAIGDVLQDQLFFLQRCGFNSFSLREDQDPREARLGLQDFSVTYQAGCDEPEPLFRRVNLG